MTSILKVSEIQDPTNSNTALTIDSSGNVTFSNKINLATIPSVFAQGGNNANKTINTGEKLGSTSQGQAAFKTDGTNGSFIQGGMSYSSTDGTFTVPVNGLYHVYGQYYLNENNSGRLQIYKNGTTAVGLAHIHMNAGTVDCSVILNLSANDTIEFRQDSGSDRTVYEGLNHTFVHIYLIG
tara:strand:- start:1103 stop:1645 length:543 start_codon:yes stop_codon:yes gene_type:complete